MSNISNFKPLRDKVFVEKLSTDARVTKSGIIIPDDNMKESGIHPRWAQVYAIGPEVTDIKVGDWLLISHGRWTNGMDVSNEDGTTTRIWGAEYPQGCLLASETDPREHILLHKTHDHGKRLRIG